MTDRTYTQQEIESTVADIERVGKIEQAPKAAAMLRQLLAERRAIEKERDDAKSEVVDSHRALMASEEFRRAYTKFCLAIPEAMAADGNWPPAKGSAWDKLRLTMPISHGPLERKTREVEHAELADLRAYRQRREAEDKADHIGDANKMVPAAGKVLTEAQAVALATRAAEIAAEAAIDVVMDRNVFAINTIAEYIKRGEYDNRTKSKTAMEREFVIAAAAVGRAWEERT